MDAFLKALADEMMMDESAALSLIYHAACDGFRFYRPVTDTSGAICWPFNYWIEKPGLTMIELASWLATHYKYLHEWIIDQFRYDKNIRMARSLEEDNAIGFLAKALYYNDPANRFDGIVV